VTQPRFSPGEADRYARKLWGDPVHDPLFIRIFLIPANSMVSNVIVLDRIPVFPIYWVRSSHSKSARRSGFSQVTASKWEFKVYDKKNALIRGGY
jgi:hypothetical protein